MQYYNLNLLEELEARPVRAMGLVRQLPPVSRLHRSFTGGLAWGWSEELLAVNAEMTHALARVVAGTFGGKKAARQIKEWHVDRPWEVRPVRRITSPREMVSVLGPILGRGSYG